MSDTQKNIETLKAEYARLKRLKEQANTLEQSLEERCYNVKGTMISGGKTDTVLSGLVLATILYSGYLNLDMECHIKEAQ